MPNPEQAPDLIPASPSERYRIAVEAIRRGGPEYTRWLNTLSPTEAYSVGELVGNLIRSTMLANQPKVEP